VKKGLAILLAMAAGGAAFLWLQTVRPYEAYSKRVIVKVPAGAGAAAVARTLTSHGVLRSRAPFLALYFFERLRHRTLKAGEYLFDRPMSPRGVYWKIERGDIYYVRVVVPEGSDRFDMARIFHEHLGIDPRAFIEATREISLIRDLDPSAPTLEGYLFPDTYRFPASATAAVAVQTMLARFRHVFDSRLRSELGNEELHRVVTLASLVEKETPDPAERAEIAGVFERRLQRGMDLDCDPTVAYAARLANQRAADPLPAREPITSAELASSSPFNTYRTSGLPPGPICSPGRASLEAALRPAPGDALYFVSNLHGGHVFASTLAEHNRNVTRYRREVDAQHAVEPPQDPAPPPSRPRTKSTH
jgi:peptidoglycan lytic transglycosylase G